MSSMRSVDSGAGQPAGAPTPGVCEPAQVRYPRKRRENWPFKFYERDGRVYQNTVPRQKRAEVGEARW